MNRCKILLPRACRSDDPLSRPLIEAFKQDSDFEVITMALNPARYIESYESAYYFITMRKPDIVMVIGDRVEQMGLAQFAFLSNTPICHFGAGITNNISTYDDIHRHNITLMSELALCEDQYSKDIVDILGQTINKTIETHIIGNPYLWKIDEVDEFLVPEEPYDLILFNETTLMKDTRSFDSDKKIVIIGPNPDHSIPLQQLIIQKRIQNYEYYETVPRNKYLGLLKNCSRFISNSSSIYYEAPYYLEKDQIVHVGLRNRDRSTRFENMGPYDPQNVVNIIKEWWNKK